MQNDKHVGLWVGVLIAMVIAVGGYFFPQIEQLAGSVGSRFPNGLAVGTTATVTQNKVTIGNSGTAIGNLLFGTCALIVQTGTIAASTTAPFDCAVTGATSADTVIALFSTSTPGSVFSGSQGWNIVGAKGSSTAGYITVDVMNLTGGAANPSKDGLASSTNYLIVR